MEKTVLISGQKVRLKTSGAFPLRFKAQFHKDYFKELTKLVPLIKLADKQKKAEERAKKKGQKVKNDLQSAVDAMSLIDFDLFYEIIWAMAKTADPLIPEPLEWLDRFETFPMVDILPEVQDLMTAMVATQKNLPAAGQGSR